MRSRRRRAEGRTWVWKDPECGLWRQLAHYTGGGRVVGRTPAGPDTGRTNKTLMVRIASLLLLYCAAAGGLPWTLKVHGFGWYLGVCTCPCLKVITAVWDFRWWDSLVFGCSGKMVFRMCSEIVFYSMVFTCVVSHHWCGEMVFRMCAVQHIPSATHVSHPTNP